MKPRIKLASAPTPDGGVMELYQHDRDFSIIVNGDDLMHSRRHESELQLALLGCHHLTGQPEATVLIGGLGMGFTLRKTLDILNGQSKVMVAELMPAVVEWNRDFLGQLNDQPLDDPRVELHTCDVVDFISGNNATFDTILLDIDNGPEAMSNAANSKIYGYQGIMACKTALRNKGCLAVWSAKPNKQFEHQVMDCGMHIHRYRVPAHKGKNASSHFIWIASESLKNLPQGGSESLKATKSAKKWPTKSKKSPWKR